MLTTKTVFCRVDYLVTFKLPAETRNNCLYYGANDVTIAAYNVSPAKTLR